MARKSNPTCGFSENFGICPLQRGLSPPHWGRAPPPPPLMESRPRRLWRMSIKNTFSGRMLHRSLVARGVQASDSCQQGRVCYFSSEPPNSNPRLFSNLHHPDGAVLSEVTTVDGECGPDVPQLRLLRLHHTAPAGRGGTWE